jgi:hypothetical protein
MKILKIVAGVFLVYLGLVALLPGITGYWQPEWEGGVQIITTGSDGNERERVLAGYWVDDKLYVCSNYWLRGWYNHAVENPEVEVVVDGKRSAYTAAPVQGAKHDQLDAKYKHPLLDDILFGFAPRRYLQLDPR